MQSKKNREWEKFNALAQKESRIVVNVVEGDINSSVDEDERRNSLFININSNEAQYLSFNGEIKTFPLGPIKYRRALLEWFVNDCQHRQFKEAMKEKNVSGDILKLLYPFRIEGFRSKFSAEHPLLIEGTANSNIFNVHYRNHAGGVEVMSFDINNADHLEKFIEIGRKAINVENKLSERSIAKKFADSVREGWKTFKSNIIAMKDKVVDTWNSGPKGKAKIIAISVLVVVLVGGMITAIVLTAGGAAPAAAIATKTGVAVAGAAIAKGAVIPAVAALSVWARLGIILGGIIGGAAALTGLVFAGLGVGLLINKGISKLKSLYQDNKLRKSGYREHALQVQATSSQNIIDKLKNQGQGAFNREFEAEIKTKITQLVSTINSFLEYDQNVKYKSKNVDISFFKNQIKEINDLIRNTSDIKILHDYEKDLDQKMKLFVEKYDKAIAEYERAKKENTLENKHQYAVDFYKYYIMVFNPILNNLNSTIKRLEPEPKIPKAFVTGAKKVKDDRMQVDINKSAENETDSRLDKKN